MIEEHHIIRHDQIFTSMKAGIIDLNNMKIMRIFFRKIIDKFLKIVGIHFGIILNHSMAGKRFDQTIKLVNSSAANIPFGIDEVFISQ